MHIYSLERMLELITDIPPEHLSNNEKCLRFLEISKKENQSEEEKKFIEDYTYEVSKENWELAEWMIKEGLRGN